MFMLLLAVPRFTVTLETLAGLFQMTQAVRSCVVVGEVRIVAAQFHVGGDRADTVVDADAERSDVALEKQRSGAVAVVAYLEVHRVFAVGAVDMRFSAEQSVDRERVGLGPACTSSQLGYALRNVSQ